MSKIDHPLAALADYLDEHRDQISKEWMAATHRDSRIESSEKLSAGELRNHLPQLLEALSDALRSAPLGSRKFGAPEDAEAHGTQRWEHGYQLDELVRELAHVREAVVQHIFRYAAIPPGLSGEDLHHAVSNVSAFLDEIIARSADELAEKERCNLQARVSVVEQSHEELKEGNERLRLVDEGRLRLLRTVSHELRNLLNAVKLSGEVLAEEDEAHTRHRLAVMLYRNVDHMDELLEDLLDFSSLIAGQKPVKFGNFQPQTLFEEVLYTYEPMAESKGLLLEGWSDPSLGLLVGDELKVKQIASNLVSNALKYTTSGRVTLQFGAVGEDRWSIVVQDTGPGIPEEELGRIFQEFHRVKETAHQQGTGLGLAITKRLVDLLGGEVRVDSLPGRGTRFEVILPRNEKTAAAQMT